MQGATGSLDSALATVISSAEVALHTGLQFSEPSERRVIPQDRRSLERNVTAVLIPTTLSAPAAGTTAGSERVAQGNRQ